MTDDDLTIHDAHDPAHAPHAHGHAQRPRIPIAELERGQEIDQPFMIARVQYRQTRAGNAHYVAGTVTDRSGQLDFRIWDANRGMMQAFVPGHVMTLKASVEEFNDTLQLNVSGFAPTPRDAINPRDFFPTTHFDPRALFNELKRLLEDLANPYLVLLRDRLFDDREGFVRPFYYAPAAVRYHHAWRHGLLEHTVSALQLAHRVCDHYPRMNRDIVLMGVFLHDAGKIFELSFGPDFDYTLEGSLIGHISLGTTMVARKIATIPDFPHDLESELLHCIVAHHGELEHGSPKQPMTPEALAVHHIECLDAHLSGMWQDQDELGRGQPLPSGEEGPGVAYSKRFRRPVLVPAERAERPLGPPHLPPSSDAHSQESPARSARGDHHQGPHLVSHEPHEATASDRHDVVDAASEHDSAPAPVPPDRVADDHGDAYTPPDSAVDKAPDAPASEPEP